MVAPTEILYWEILPALRSQMVLEMKESGLKQKEIAEILDVTPAAISQYLNNKRGKFTFSEKFLKSVKESVQSITSKQSTAFVETTKLLKEFEHSKDLCKVCHGKNNLPKNCKACF